MSSFFHHKKGLKKQTQCEVFYLVIMINTSINLQPDRTIKGSNQLIVNATLQPRSTGKTFYIMCQMQLTSPIHKNMFFFFKGKKANL